jgi:NADH:ubiquinone oxidoreductase subunit K
MYLGDLNTLFILFYILLGTLVLHTNTSLHFLLTAELLWVTLYAIVTFIGLSYDNTNLLSLSFFFLIFSAVEFGVGLLVSLLQHFFSRTLNLSAGDTNTPTFTTNFIRRLHTNTLKWKY